MRRINQHQKGFTLVELMIATVVFSIVLLVITQALIQVGRIYYKGTISTRTQEATRSTVDDIAQTIQLSGGTVNTNLSQPSGTVDVKGFCSGNRRFSYYIGQQLNGNPRRLVADDISAAGGCSAATETLSTCEMDLSQTGCTHPGDELLSPKMRLAKLSVTQSGTVLYDISVRIAYGDNDVLCSPGVSGDCSSATSNTSATTEDDIVCKNFASMSSMCSVSEVNTTVNKRLE